MMQVQHISNGGLFAGLGLMGVSVILMLSNRIPLGQDMVIATGRTIGQLLLVGYVLQFIFQANNWPWVMGYLLFMLLAASWTVYSRAKKQGRSSFWDIKLALLVGSGLTIWWTSQIIIGIKPWYDPQYLIPLSGMVLGNSINSAALGIDRLQGELRNQKNGIETLLALGATPRKAADECLKAALIAAMIPNINAMMVVGLVSLPGMMTGQILAGQLPLSAVYYQIIVMFMITCASAITTTIMLQLALRKSFNQAEQLIE